MNRIHKLDEYLRHLLESLYLHAGEDYPPEAAEQIRALLERALAAGVLSDAEIEALLKLMARTRIRSAREEAKAERGDDWEQEPCGEESSGEREEERLLRENAQREQLRIALRMHVWQRALMRRLRELLRGQAQSPSPERRSRGL